MTAVIVLGGATRVFRSTVGRKPMDPKSAALLQRQVQAVDSALAAKSSGSGRRRKKSSSTDSPHVFRVVDLDFASSHEIETLRGIGPAMAARIVADRDSFGAFGSIEGFQRVKGVGPALAGKLAGHVTFSGVPRPVSTVVSRRSVKKDPKRKSRRREEVY